MRIDYVHQLLEHEPASVGEELDRLQGMVKKASKEARILLFELRPIALETQGLARGLETYVEQLQGDSSPTFHFDDGGFDERLETDLEATAFMVVQEAMNNARKHSAAANVWLDLEPDGDRLLITVRDDGAGFDLQDAKNNSNMGAHLGLVSMQERAQEIGAELDILTEQGGGTRVILGVPRRAPSPKP
jgi:signal transduction histidine kinase